MTALLLALLMTPTARANDLTDALYASDADRAAAVAAVQSILTPERAEPKQTQTRDVINVANK